ncbi:hypothetical protein J437_LFUL012623 [Ladona fulva]|uniref:Lipase domain-containing protein n=1 Tax=Ladona fulva TaxID=123851 RepID=A0A8K0KFB3_LADFU|nr:hypothetical protein J437_LFUL012623 [Ladona fulva]
MYFPDGDGNPRAAIVYPNDDEESTVADSLRSEYKQNPEKYIFFFLYTRRGNSQLFVGDVASLHGSKFDASLPTRLITHGFTSSEEATAVQSIKDKYVEVEDCNVIGVDWSKLAGTVNYNLAKRRTKVVGSYTAKLIDFLVNEGKMKLADVHLIGHSLGAHVMGLAGKNVQSGKVSRITDRITVGDAEFVDIIHTCGGKLAFHKPIGDVDFYPNLVPALTVALWSSLQNPLDPKRLRPFLARVITNIRRGSATICPKPPWVNLAQANRVTVYRNLRSLFDGRD